MTVNKGKSTGSGTSRAKKTNTKTRSHKTTGRTPQRKHVKGTSASRRTNPHKVLEETTFVYECTRPGCGYRIWRSDKEEPGKLRLDLKCPKCHNESFRCLGKGDLPESFNVPLPATTLDFNKVDRVGLGTN